MMVCRKVAARGAGERLLQLLEAYPGRDSQGAFYQALLPHRNAMFVWRKERLRLMKAVIFSFLSIVSFRGDRDHMKMVLTVVSHEQSLHSLVSRMQSSERRVIMKM